ncbi:MAG: uL30 family ribosomal protein [Candidatus Micrarchaeia archaeon]
MSKNNLEGKLLAAVRVRGRVGLREDISETLDRLNLRRVNNLAIIAGSKPAIGMLHKGKDYITYGEISKETLKSVFEKNHIQADDKTIEDLIACKKDVKEVAEMPIRMKPPKRGYESTKKNFSVHGALGYRGEKINDLIKRML